MTPNHRERAETLLFQLRRPADAEQAALQALTRDPDNGYLHVLLAEARRRQGKLDAAEAAARQAVGLAPQFSWAYSTLGLILLERGRCYEALPLVTEAIRLDPANSEHYESTACVHMALGRNEEAAKAAEGGLYHDPQHVGCLNRLAVALAMTGRKGKAWRELERALAINPEDTQTHCNLGWLAGTDLRFWTAIHHYREALRLDPMASNAVDGMRDKIEWITRIVMLGSVLFGMALLMLLNFLFQLWVLKELCEAVFHMVWNVGILMGGLVFSEPTGKVLILRLSPAGRKLMTEQDRIDLISIIIIIGITSIVCIASFWLESAFSGLCGIALLILCDNARQLWRYIESQFLRSGVGQN